MVLIDLDSVCRGPREWDLVPMAVTARRFTGDPSVWANFLAGYGVDDRTLPDLDAAILIKELSMIAFMCQSSGQSARLDAEIARRLQMLKRSDLNGRWGAGFGVVRA